MIDLNELHKTDFYISIQIGIQFQPRLKFIVSAFAFTCVCVCVYYCGPTVIVWWTQGVVSHTPPRGEDDKVSNRHTRSRGFGSQHSKDRWIL